MVVMVVTGAGAEVVRVMVVRGGSVLLPAAIGVTVGAGAEVS